MKVKISVFVIWAKLIIYLLLYNLRDCTFNIFKEQNFNCVPHSNISEKNGSSLENK